MSINKQSNIHYYGNIFSIFQSLTNLSKDRSIDDVNPMISENVIYLIQYYSHLTIPASTMTLKRKKKT